jgi:hypothetical protein
LEGGTPLTVYYWFAPSHPVSGDCEVVEAVELGYQVLRVLGERLKVERLKRIQKLATPVGGQRPSSHGDPLTP